MVIHCNRNSEGKVQGARREYSGETKLEWRAEDLFEIWHLIISLKMAIYDLNLELSENDVLGVNLKLP